MALNYEENIDAFAIVVRREIVFYLRQLINDAERMTVMFDAGRETLLTMPLDIDEDADLLIFDWGGSESVNRRLLASQRSFFVATPLGIRHQFAATQIWERAHNRQPAFATRIPERLVRLQRREFFRLPLPPRQRRPCTLVAGAANTPWEMSIVDIGLGGVALESPIPALPFEIGQAIPRATLDLGKFGKIEVALEIRYVGSDNRGEDQVGRLGCHFVKLSRIQENELQRFMTLVQREEAAIARAPIG
jgi:c-di-GMP-binding flagellar brake protein YcgR